MSIICEHVHKLELWKSFINFGLLWQRKWNESGFRPPLCTYRLNWARRTSWGWWDDWDNTVLHTGFEIRALAVWGHATSRSRRLPTIMTFTRGWGRNILCFFQTAVKGSGANHYPRAPAFCGNVAVSSPQLWDDCTRDMYYIFQIGMLAYSWIFILSRRLVCLDSEADVYPAKGMFRLWNGLTIIACECKGRVVVSTAAFHARVRGSLPGLGGLKETTIFLLHPLVKLSIVGSLRVVACSASDLQGLNFESCVWSTVSSHSSHHPQEVLLAQFRLYVHKSGIKPDSFHFIFEQCKMFIGRGGRNQTCCYYCLHRNLA